jgi:hypothetical protein
MFEDTSAVNDPELDFIETIPEARNHTAPHKDTTRRLFDMATGLLLPFTLTISPGSCEDCFAEKDQEHHAGCLKSEVECGIETDEDERMA